MWRVFRAKLGSIRKTGSFKCFCEIKLSVRKGAANSSVVRSGHLCTLYPLMLGRKQPSLWNSSKRLPVLYFCQWFLNGLFNQAVPLEPAPRDVIIQWKMEWMCVWGKSPQKKKKICFFKVKKELKWQLSENSSSTVKGREGFQSDRGMVFWPHHFKAGWPSPLLSLPKPQFF